MTTLGVARPVETRPVQASQGKVLFHQGGFIILVLTRSKDQSIVVNEDIFVQIIEVKGDKIRVGITAPKEVPVHRYEVWELIRKQRRDAEART